MEFFLNNLSFTIQVAISVVFFTSAWLAYDAYLIQKEGLMLTRSAGFLLVGVANVIGISIINSDIISFLTSGFSIFGLLLILISYLYVKKLEVASVILIPTFSVWSLQINVVMSLLCVAIGLAALYKVKREQNKTDIPLSLGFISLAIGYLILAVNLNSSSYFLAIQYLAFFAGILFFVRWLWHYMQLRFEESFVVILISSALFLATIITLAFSTLLIERIDNETKLNLAIDTRVMDLAIRSLTEESSAKSQLLATNEELIQSFLNNESELALKEIADFMQNYNVGFVILADSQGSVVARAHAPTKIGDTVARERGFEEALLGKSFVTVDRSDVEGLSIRATSPLRSDGEFVGAVILGFQLDNPFLDKLKRVTGLDLFIFEDGLSVASTAFAQNGTTRLVGGEPVDSTIIKSVIDNGEFITETISIKGSKYEAGVMPLVNGDNKNIGMISAAKPQGEILKIINDTNRLTLLTVIIVLIFMSVPIYSLSRKIVKQIS